MRTEEVIKAKVAKTEALLEAQEEELHAAQGRRFLKCLRKVCGRKSRLSKWIFIVNHHYIAPYSCSSGDYWVRSKGSEDLVCPHCGHEHRRIFLEKTMSDEDFRIAEKVAGHLLHRYGEYGRRDEIYVYR